MKIKLLILACISFILVSCNNEKTESEKVVVKSEVIQIVATTQTSTPEGTVPEEEEG